MDKTDRRTFMLHVIATSSALAASGAMAQAGGAKVEETDAQAIALGYKRDTAKVDAAKYPKHTAAQTCANCQLYQGKPKDPFGGCQLFVGKLVAAGAWCSAWAKKA
jgi:hypothetical protein